MKITLIKSPIFWLVFSFLSLTTNAQTLIKANDKSIRYDLIKPSHYFQKVTAYDSSGAVKYELMNEGIIKIDALNGQMIFERSRQFPFGQQYNDSSVMNNSGSPISYFMTSNPLARELKVTFNLKSAVTMVNSKGVPSVNTTELPEGYFDDNTIEALLGYIPFVKGVKYHLNCFTIDNKSGLNPFDIEYIFDDFYQKPNGDLVKCAILHFVNSRSSAYVWVDKVSRLNLKEVFQNENGNTVVLKI